MTAETGEGPHTKAAALLELLKALEAVGYDFVTPTPETHGRVLARAGHPPGDGLRTLLGWSLPVAPADAPPSVLDLLARAEVLRTEGGLVRSTVRVSRLHGLLFLHSAYPTTEDDAVFLGPDSYRFADFLAREIAPSFQGRLVDVGGGCGVGGITVGHRAPLARVTVADINPRALALARVNALQAGVVLNVVQADGLAAADGVDLVVANPPYMADAGQTYAKGGGMHGGALSLDWAKAALERLRPGGRLLLYTGSAITLGGVDALRGALETLCDERGAGLDYQEIDPDVFGEALVGAAYSDVERIAAIGCVITAARR